MPSGQTFEELLELEGFTCYASGIAGHAVYEDDPDAGWFESMGSKYIVLLTGGGFKLLDDAEQPVAEGTDLDALISLLLKETR